MNIPVETKPALWGIAGGAVALAIVGFTWGGWVTAGKAETESAERAKTAVVVALAPVCAERFQRATEAEANLAALKKTESWSRGEFVEKGGWAGKPATNSPDQAQVAAVARACAELLVPA